MDVEEKLILLYQQGQGLIVLRDIQKIAASVLDIIAHTLGFPDSVFLMVDENRGELYSVARRGKLAKVEDLRLPLDGGEEITIAVVKSGKPLLVGDVRQDPHLASTGYPMFSELAVPVEIEGRVLAVIDLKSTQPEAFNQTDIENVGILASLAGLALENTRLYEQERHRAEIMTAVNQVARRISASLDFQQTLDAIVKAAMELTPCTLSAISLWDEKRQVLVLQALRCELETPLSIGWEYPLGKGLTGWVAREKRPLLVGNMETFTEIRPDPLPEEPPFKAYLGLPLLSEGKLIGILELTHTQANGFDKDDLEPAEALAGQAAVVIRNVDLYTKLERHHREHSVLYSVIRAINRPLNLDDLLEDTLERVLEVSQADGGVIRLIDEGTDEFVLATHRGMSETYVREASRFQLSHEIKDWVASDSIPALSEDMWTDPHVSPEVRKMLGEGGHHSLAQVPLIAQERLVGALSITSKIPGFFKEDDLKLLNAISQQLGVAIQNARLFEDTQRKAHRLAALNAVAAAINQSIDLDALLNNAVEQIVQVVGVDAAGIRLLDPQTNTLKLIYHRGLSPEYAALIESYPVGEGTSGRVVLTGEPRLIADMWEEESSQPFVREQLAKEGLRARVEVPLRSRERIIGTMGVASCTVGAFGSEDVDLLNAIGHQLGVAIENAHLREEAIRAERLAAVGRVATSVAHDLRSPLGGIMRSAEFLARPELSQDTRQKLSRAIVSLSRRLVNTSQEILDYVHGGKLPLKLCPHPLPEFLDEVLAVLQVDFSDQGIEVQKSYRYEGQVVMDADRMAQVVYNIAANARDAMPQGGTFTVETELVGERVELRLSDTGPGVPVELSDRIFEPFTSYGKRIGAGLGLAIARRIVEEHGGELKLVSNKGLGAKFVASLPI